MMRSRLFIQGIGIFLVFTLIVSTIAITPKRVSAKSNDQETLEYIYVQNQQELDSLLQKYNDIAREFGDEITNERVAFDDTIKNSPMLTPEAFKAQVIHSKTQENGTLNTDDNSNLLRASTSTKTYKRTDKMPIFGFLFKFTMYAKVTKKSGKITKVSQWSEQSGLSYPVKVTVSRKWYSLSKSKKSGTAYFRLKKYKYLVPGHPEMGWVSYSTESLKF